MSTRDITFQEASSRLFKLYSDLSYHRLIGKLNEPTLLELAGKLGSETVLSSLYAWVFGNKEFNEGEKSPILQLLRLLTNEAYKNGGIGLINDELGRKILTNDIKIISVVVDKEVPTTGDTNNGRIDIVIWAKVLLGDNSQTLRILVENKIYTPEHDDQCRKYHDFFSNPANKRRESDQTTKSDIDIYCFLAIDKKGKLSEPHYIRITHQEVLDYILTPLKHYASHYTVSSRKYLDELVNSLISIKTNGKPQIAMDEETQAMLKDFYKNNSEIIEAAVMAAATDSKVIAQVTKIRNPSSYVIVNNTLGISKVTNQKSLLRDLVDLYINQMGLSINDVQVKFKALGKAFIQDDSVKGYDPMEINGHTWYISNQKARRDTKFDEIKAIAEADGFQII